jgi:hypothetical protein
VKAVHPEGKGVEKGLAQNLGDAGAEHGLHSGGTERLPRLRGLKRRHLHDGDAGKLSRPRTAAGRSAQGFVGQGENEAWLPGLVAEQSLKDVLAFEHAAEICE